MKRFTSYISPLLLAAVGVLASLAVQAQSAGFINRDRIVREAKAAQGAQDRLRQEFAKREKELVDLDKTFKESVQQYQKETEKLNAADRQDRERKLAELEDKLGEKQRDFENALSVRKNEELQKVFEAADKAIAQIAQTEKLDFVLVDAAYINPKIDITDKVLQVLNK